VVVASEWFASTPGTSLWALVDAVHARILDPPATARLTDQAAYELAVALAADTLGAPAAGLLGWALGVHDAAAAVEAHRQLFLETVVPRLPNSTAWTACPVVAVVNQGALATCIVDAGFVAAAASLPSQPAPSAAPDGVRVATLQHAYPAPPAAAPHLRPREVVLYGELGTIAFADAHTKLAAAARAGQIAYAVRHWVAQPAAETAAATVPARAALAGYGVELAIKNTEYKAQDDAALRAERTGGAGAGVGAGAGDDEDAALPSHVESPKAVRTEGLAAKAVYRLLQSADPLAALRHLAQNLPTTAHALALQPPAPPAVLAALEAARATRVYASGLVFVNGRSLSAADVNEVSPYALLPLLRTELWTIEAIMAAGLEAAQATTLLGEVGATVADASPAHAHVIDVRTPAAVFLNDLSTEPRYAQFGGRLAAIVGMPLLYQGQMLFLRFNLITVLFVLDPTDLAQVTTLSRVAQYVQRAVPLRFGVLWLDGDAGTRAALARPTDPTGAVPRTTSVTALLYRAMAVAKQAKGDAGMHRFLFEYARQAALTASANVETVKQAALAMRWLPWRDVEAAGDAAGPLDVLAAQAHADAAARGIEPGSIFVNGEYLPWEMVRGDIDGECIQGL
jgi:UDP-glucose:glycoprotein glucosyltransferase